MSNKTISEVVKLKRRLYVELVKLTAAGKLSEKISELPFQMITKDSPRYRCCEFKERAIFTERIKAALGFSPADTESVKLSELAEQLLADQLPKQESIVEVIATACDRCPIDKYFVTDACRNCVAHKCVNACPAQAIVIIQNKAFIDQNKCIECGRCAAACSYNAILENQRPCARACAVNAIKADKNRQAKIDSNKCVSCGSCIEACPFGAIAEKSDLVKVCQHLINPAEKVIAMLAPSFVGQFGFKVSAPQIKYALKELGFNDVVEVARGADLVAAAESKELTEAIETGQVLLSSCCTAFKNMVKNDYSELAANLSQTNSPMAVAAAEYQIIDPAAKLVFIGPCTAKKAEALNNPDLDYVLTFEELIALVSGFEMNLATVTGKEKIEDASKLGRQFAYAGGLENSLAELIEINYKSKQADGLANCQQELALIKANRHDYSFLEGMACSGGCVGGPAAMINQKAAKKFVNDFAIESNLDPAK